MLIIFLRCYVGPWDEQNGILHKLMHASEIQFENYIHSLRYKYYSSIFVLWNPTMLLEFV